MEIIPMLVVFLRKMPLRRKQLIFLATFAIVAAAIVFTIGYANRQKTVAISVSQPPDAVTGATPRLMPQVQVQSRIQAKTDLQKAFNLVAREVEPAVVHIHVVGQAAAWNVQITDFGFRFFPATPAAFPSNSAEQTLGAYCICPNCGHYSPHPRGMPCSTQACPFCKSGMIRNVAGTAAAPNAPSAPANQLVGNVGSGFFVHPKGYILTNYHLVTGAKEIDVVLFGSPNVLHNASLLDADPDADLALLKLDSPGVYPVAELGDSNNIEVGDWVLAVGSPFGLEHTVTAGIISDTRRDLTVQGKRYRDLIQTDAPINEGNSGGPLVDLNGEVVGVNTALYSPGGGGFTGIGFTIPINGARPLLAGVIDLADPAMARPAAAWSAPQSQAPCPTNTPTTAAPCPTGTTGAAAAPAAPSAPQFQNAASKQLAEGHWLGMEVIPLTPELAQEMGISPQEKGVLVDDVTLVAADAGIIAGDMVQRIGRDPVTDLKSFYEATKKVVSRREVTVRISRKGHPLIIEIEQRDPVGVAQMEAAPMIRPGSAPPHRYKGPCTNCHTIGNTGQLAVDQGDIISRTAPPIARGARPPHKNRGECALCHQIR
ncbi:MAG: trypsin-like peptidase domain-containing protein [bacterium]